MCLEHNPRRMDRCLVALIHVIRSGGIKTLGSCCGHGRYSMTVVCMGKDGKVYEAMTGKAIPRKTRFYKKDSQGYYYIPEINKVRP